MKKSKTNCTIEIYQHTVQKFVGFWWPMGWNHFWESILILQLHFHENFSLSNYFYFDKQKYLQYNFYYLVSKKQSIIWVKFSLLDNLWLKFLSIIFSWVFNCHLNYLNCIMQQHQKYECSLRKVWSYCCSNQKYST